MTCTGASFTFWPLGGVSAARATVLFFGGPQGEQLVLSPVVLGGGCERLTGEKTNRERR